MEEYEKALVELFNVTPLPAEAKMYVLYKHVRDTQDLVRAEKLKKADVERSENDEQMS